MNINNINTFFFISDLHGIDPSKVRKGLEKVGFDKNNETHCIVVAGDLCDGYNQEHALFDYLRSFKNSIIIRGNHDLAKSGGYYQNVNYYWLSQKNKEWLRTLPIRYENDLFRMAHGMLIPHELKYKINYENHTIWGCPIMLASKQDKQYWWHVTKDSVEIVRNFFNNSLDNYSKYYGDKLLFLGHFGKKILTQMANEQGIVLKKLGKFLRYKNIIWLDQTVIRTNQVNVLRLTKRQIHNLMRKVKGEENE